MNLDLTPGLTNQSVGKSHHLWVSPPRQILFHVLVFNDLLRSPEPGSHGACLPKLFSGRRQRRRLQPTCGIIRVIKQLVIRKLPADAAFDLAVGGKTGFTFFSIGGSVRLRS